MPLEVKNQRVGRLVRAFRQGAEEINKRLIGSIQLVLVEGVRLICPRRCFVVLNYFLILLVGK